MKDSTHISTGLVLIAAAAGITSIINHQLTDPDMLLNCYTGAFLGALTPDVDEAKSISFRTFIFKAPVIYTIALLLSIVSITAQLYLSNQFVTIPVIKIIAFTLFLLGIFLCHIFFEHRTLTHSIIGIIFFCTVIYFIFSPIAFAYFVGYMLHILEDILCDSGVMLFYPFSKKKAALHKFKFDKDHHLFDTITRTCMVIMIIPFSYLAYCLINLLAGLIGSALFVP